MKIMIVIATRVIIMVIPMIIVLVVMVIVMEMTALMLMYVRTTAYASVGERCCVLNAYDRCDKCRCCMQVPFYWRRC